MVRFNHPIWRTVVYPFYTRAEFMFVVFMIVTVLVVGSQLPLPRPTWQYALVGYVGAVLFNRTGSPAHVVRSAADQPKIVSFLDENGFKYDDREAAWIPPWPTWKRWSYTRVKLASGATKVTVEGPYRILKALEGHLQR